MKPILQTEHNSEKEIASGKFRECYLIYNRKSTDEANNQKNSIKYQKMENGRFAMREQLPLAPITIKGFCTDGIISEKHSGFKENDELIIDKGLVQYRIERPKFLQLVQYLNRGLFKGVIVLCWDRISRNKGDDTVIRKLMKKGIDIRFLFATYDKTSAGELHMDIDGMFAEHYARVTGEKVATMTRNLREKGMCTYRAPIGYLNPGTMQKPFDPERAPIIKRIFELYATGNWSLADLSRWANQQGLTTVPMRKRRTREEILDDEEDTEPQGKIVSRPITATHIHDWFHNPFYVGKILQPDGSYKKSRSHEALVSEELVAQIHAQLQKKKTSMYYEKKLDLFYRGLARCAFCNRVYTPYVQKGTIYYGCRCRPDCLNKDKNFSISYLEKMAGNGFAGLYLADEEKNEIINRLQTDTSLLETRRNNELENQARNKQYLYDNLAYLRSNKLVLLKSGVYTPEALFDEETRLESEITRMQETALVEVEEIYGIMTNTVTLSELLKHLYFWYAEGNSEEREEILRILYSELLFSEKALECKCKKEFEVFEDHSILVGGSNTGYSELVKYKDSISAGIEKLQLFLKNKSRKLPSAKRNLQNREI